MKTTPTCLSSYLAHGLSIYIKKKYLKIFSFLTTVTHTEKKEAQQRWSQKKQERKPRGKPMPFTWVKLNSSLPPNAHQEIVSWKEGSCQCSSPRKFGCFASQKSGLKMSGFFFHSVLPLFPYAFSRLKQGLSKCFPSLEKRLLRCGVNWKGECKTMLSDDLKCFSFFFLQKYLKFCMLFSIE